MINFKQFEVNDETNDFVMNRNLMRKKLVKLSDKNDEKCKKQYGNDNIFVVYLKITWKTLYLSLLYKG